MWKTVNRVRRAYFIEQKTQRQIAKELHLARKTVRKAIESAEPAVYTLQVSRGRRQCLSQYKARIDAAADGGREDAAQAAVHRAQDFPVAATGWLSRAAESTVRGYIGQQRQEQRRPRCFCRWSSTLARMRRWTGAKPWSSSLA